jgi:hypothetical protein
MRAVVLLMLSSACTGVEEPDPPAPLPSGCLQVEPVELRFAPTRAAEAEDVRTVTLSNRCADHAETGSVEIVDVAIDGGPPFTAGPIGLLSLDSGESQTVELTFRPTLVGQFEDVLRIRSTDPNAAMVAVSLLGSGTGPELVAAPGSFDYGAPYIGCEVTQPVTLGNAGSTELVIGSIDVLTASMDEFGVVLDVFNNGELPFRLAPLDDPDGLHQIEIYIDYTALDVSADTAVVQITSNDPGRPVALLEARGTGTHFSSQRDEFSHDTTRDVDLLFTLNRSASMADNVDDVLAALDEYARRLSSMDGSPHVALVVADDGCVVGPDAFIDESFSASEASAALETMADLDFSLAAYGSYTERGFNLAEAALSTRNTGPGGCNEAFYREDADLVVIPISDAPDGSGSSWSYFVALFQSLKADPERVRISAIAGDYPSGCASASPGTGYYEGTIATGGQFLSICSDRWGRTLDLPSAERGGGVQLRLSRQPVPQTIEVWVDGARWPGGWQYEISGGSVHFDPDATPPLPDRAKIEIRYEVMPRCEG